MSTYILGIGDFGASRKPGDVIKTLALGSCVAVILYDLETRTAGMIHIALPEAKISPERAAKCPGHFADTGLPKLVRDMNRAGCDENCRKWVVKLVGGASVMDPNSIFNIGERNVVAIRKELRKFRMIPTAEDVGKNFSRSVDINVSTGRVTVISAGRKNWEV